MNLADECYSILYFLPFRELKRVLLSLLPETWSREKLQQEIGASDWLIREVLRNKATGQNCTLTKRGKRSLSPNTVQEVKNFYEDDDNSRQLPGLKDCISVKNENGEKEKRQKKLVLCNLRELFLKFKEENPNCSIGFSKFADLRPEHCVLAGSPGTHTVCVCTFHQNVKLLLEGKLEMTLMLSNCNVYF